MCIIPDNHSLLLSLELCLNFLEGWTIEERYLHSCALALLQLTHSCGERVKCGCVKDVLLFLLDHTAGCMLFGHDYTEQGKKSSYNQVTDHLAMLTP